MSNLLHRPFEPLLDRLGNANPQLLRELRGRLKPGFVLATLGTSIAGQLLYGLNRLGFLPSTITQMENNTDRYCLGPITKDYGSPICIKDALGNISINWPLWWGDGLPGLHWTMLSIAIVIGSYLLIADWSSEADRGTLDPLRLSPQSAPSILWGKLLGVPVLVYFFLLSGLPLYVMAMVEAGRSPATIVGGLAIDLAQMTFWFTTSLLFAACFTKGGGAKAILGAMVVAMGLFSAFLITNRSPLGWMFDVMRLISPSLGFAGGLPSSESYYQSSFSQQYLQGNTDWAWFGMPIGTSMLRLSLFTVGVLGAWSYGCWLALNRRFDRPTATPWSKGQSYGITAGVTTIVLGSISARNSGNIDFINGQIPLFWLLMPLGLTLIQSRQSLLDWVRHPAAPTASHTAAHRQDLIWGESSPPWVAFGIHVAIVALLLVPYNLLRLYMLDNGSTYATDQIAVLTFLLMTSLGLLLVGLSQLIHLRSRQRAWFLSVIAIAVGLFALPIGLTIFSQYNGQHVLWLLTFYPLGAIDESEALGMVIAVLAFEWLALALIYRQFDRSLRLLASSRFAQALQPTRPQTHTRS